MITIGIGCGADAWKVVQSANETATEDLHIRCYCCPGAVDDLSSGPFVELAVCSLPYQHIVDDLLAHGLNSIYMELDSMGLHYLGDFLRPGEDDVLSAGAS